MAKWAKPLVEETNKEATISEPVLREFLEKAGEQRVIEALEQSGILTRK